MPGFLRRPTFAFVLALVALCSLTAAGPVSAQDGWSFVLTPQVWLSHISLNGFAAPPASAVTANLQGQTVPITDAEGNPLGNFLSSTSSPNASITPQWGLR